MTIFSPPLSQYFTSQNTPRPGFRQKGKQSVEAPPFCVDDWIFISPEFSDGERHQVAVGGARGGGQERERAPQWPTNEEAPRPQGKAPALSPLNLPEPHSGGQAENTRKGSCQELWNRKEDPGRQKIKSTFNGDVITSKLKRYQAWQIQINRTFSRNRGNWAGLQYHY